MLIWFMRWQSFEEKSQKILYALSAVANDYYVSSFGLFHGDVPVWEVRSHIGC